MYFFTHITFQGIFLVSLISITLLGFWWGDR